jgi:hypothetical protein
MAALCTVFLMILTSFAAVTFVSADNGIRSNAPTLTNANVTPSSGKTSTVFVFSVYYTDFDGDMPFNMDIMIDNNWYKMMTNDTDAMRGMFKLTKGNHSYHFFASNMKNETVSDPKSGKYSIYVEAEAPGNVPQLYDHSFYPERPIANQTVNFTVQYRLPDNKAPTLIQFNLRKSDPANTYTNYDMKINGTSYSTGVTCFKTLILTEGEYYYNFHAAYGNASINDPSSGDYYLYVGNGSGFKYPYLTGGGVSPINGTAYKTEFKFNVIYQDGSYGPAEYAYVVIDNSMYKMNEEKNDSGSAGIYYYCSVYLGEGNHTYYFLFSDGKVNITLPSSGTFKGPYVIKSKPQYNEPPRVSLNIYPLAGDLNTTFYFNATIVDPDGDEMTYEWVFTDGYNVSGHYNVSGKLSFTRKFNYPGVYFVTLSVTDSRGLTTTASEEVLVSRTDYPPKNTPPVIKTNLESTIIKQGTIKYISAVGSYDPDGDKLTYKWTIIRKYSNETDEFKVAAFNYTFKEVANYTIYLQVSDSWATATAEYLIVCIKNVPQRTKPVARAIVTTDQMTAKFSGATSSDSDGYIVSYIWTIENAKYNGSAYTHTYKTSGYKTATLKVTDNDGLSDTAIVGFYVSDRKNDPDRNNSYDTNTPIGSHVNVEGDTETDVTLTTLNSLSGFLVKILDYGRNYLKLEVESESETGKLVIVDIIEIFDFEVLDRIEINMDGITIEYTELDIILQTSGDEPLYHIIADENKIQLLVYIPHFSKHIVEVKVQSDDTDLFQGYTDITANYLPIFGIIIIAIIIIVIVLFMKLKKKKKIEYYNDFRVAEEKTSNGNHGKQDYDEPVDWDDYI